MTLLEMLKVCLLILTHLFISFFIENIFHMVECTDLFLCVALCLTCMLSGTPITK